MYHVSKFVVVSTLFFFFFNDTATTEIYTLSLHDALPISGHESTKSGSGDQWSPGSMWWSLVATTWSRPRDRKSTRLNSSHANISYAVFCLKKKKKNIDNIEFIYSKNIVKVYIRLRLSRQP